MNKESLETMRQKMKTEMFGDKSYFVKDGNIVKISDVADAFVDYEVIRKATDEEIAIDNLYWTLYNKK